ncbi:hypothetical protein ASB65_27015 [Agrobacterium tumefaciens str. B6]|nr:hypothetical protein ASB65_27015 [Agrobacterium tumefaciens str. B6]
MCEIDPGIGVEVAECRRKAVASMIKRRTAHGPQGILKPFSQRDKAFAAENDMGVFKARPDKPEVIEQVIKRLAGDGYTKTAGVGKIRKAQPAWLVRLAEDDLLSFAMDSTPRPDASLKRAADTFREFWMSAQHLIVDGDSTDAGSGLQEGDDFCLKYRFQGIRAAASAWRFALRWQLHLLVEAVCRGSADRRFCRGDLYGMRLSVLHEESHLMIGYMATRHKLVLQSRKPQMYRTDRDHETPKICAAPGYDYDRATPSLRHTPARVSS